MDSVESQIKFILNEHFNIKNLEVINESYILIPEWFNHKIYDLFKSLYILDKKKKIV